MNPRTFVELEKDELTNLRRKHAQVLCAVAEAVIGPDFAETIGGAGRKQDGFREFVRDVDDLMNYQDAALRGQVRQALTIIEVPLLRHALLVRFGDGDFSKLSLDDRRGLFARLKAGEAPLQRQFYTGLVHLVSSFYFGHPNVFPGIGYPGVSVDHPELLTRTPVPWRPHDPTPVKP